MTKVLFFVGLLCTAFLGFSFRRIDPVLTVKVTNLASTHGKLYVLVYDQQAGFPTNPAKALRKVEAKMTSTSPEIAITGLPVGKYAFVVFHDKNANGKLDKGWFGSPQEAYGFSNLPSDFCGTPSFQQTVVDFDAAHAVIAIKLIQP
jgi:uncharacterized protein (DUF2141 family)